MTSREPARIGLIGFGSIGRELVRHLEPEFRRGELAMAGAVVRDVVKHGAERERLELEGRVPAGWPVKLPGIAELVADSELVVECAGVRAAHEYVRFAIAQGRTLLIASVGVLAGEREAAQLEAGPGRLIPTAGAIGGLDLLRAAAQADGLDLVRITTTKQPRSLLQPWMPAAERERLAALRPGDPAVELFSGTPIEAIARFPTNVNVAVTVAEATRRRDAEGRLEPRASALARVEVRLVADANARRSRHEIVAAGAAGDYAFAFENRPSRANPRSSALTAQSMALEVRGWLSERGRG